MILFFTFLLFQILVTTIGVGILRAFYLIQKNSIESLTIGYLIGAVFFSFYIFLILLLGGSLSPLSVGIYLILGITGTVYLIGKRGVKDYLSLECFLPFTISDGWAKTSFIQKGLISLMGILLCFKLLLGLWFVFNAPAYFDDAIHNWNVRAKNIYFEKSLNFNQENKEMSFLGGGRYFYPFFTVAYKAGLSQFLGEWHEGYANLFHFIAFIILILIFFLKSYEYSKGDFFIASIFTFIVSSTPLTFFHSFTAHADIMTGMFFVLTLIYLIDYIKGNEIKKLILSGIFLFGTTFTKNEGLVIIFSSTTFTVIIFSFLWKDWRFLIPSIITFILMLPHNLLRILYDIKPDAGIEISIGYHKHAITMLKIVMTEWGHSNILWFIVPVILIFFLWHGIGKREIQFAFVALFFAGFSIFLTYCFTSNFIFLQDQTSINRELMIFSFPLVYLLMMIAVSVKGKTNL